MQHGLHSRRSTLRPVGICSVTILLLALALIGLGADLIINSGLSNPLASLEPLLP